MKHIDLFCSSPASTAICSSMDPRAMVRAGSRSMSSVGESKRGGRSPVIPVDPAKTSTCNNLNKSARRKSFAANSRDRGHSCSTNASSVLTTPTGSSRYLLNESNRHKFFDLLAADDHHSDHLKTIVIPKPEIMKAARDSPSPKPSPSTPNSIISRTQVVELMVSIHCKGCEGKVRRHISKMEGVTSVKIDLELKKVTVIGEVTPLQVLTSISRVKTAQFWPSSPKSLPFSVSPSPNIMISSMSPSMS